MQGSQPIRYLVILSTDESSDVSAGAVTLGRIAAPYYFFKDQGAEVVLATLTGGYPCLPGYRETDTHEKSLRRFLLDRAARDELADTLAADQIVAEDFDAALCLGLSGALWGNCTNSVTAILTTLLENGKPVAVIPGKAVAIAPHGAGEGLLIFGDSDNAPIMAAHALAAIVTQRRSHVA